MRAVGTDDEWVWALRILQKELESDLQALQPDLPAKYRSSEAALRRLLFLGRTERERLEEARKLAETKYPELLWAVHVTFGRAEYVADDVDKEKHFRTALELAERKGDRLAIATVHSARAFQLTSVKRYGEAVDAGRLALEIFTDINATGRLATAAGNLGWAYIDVGDWENAREYFELAKSTADLAGGPGRVTWRNQLGNVFFMRRMYVAADVEYRRAYELGKTDNHREIPNILNNRARTALYSGRVANARRLMPEALAAAAARGEKEQQFAASILDARIATKEGDHARAEKIFQKVIAEAKLIAAPTTQWLAHGHLAELYVHMRRTDDARANFRQAIAKMGEVRAAIHDRELRLSFFNLSEEIFNSYVDFLVDSKRIDEALAATELMRAQSLEEGLEIKPWSRPLEPREIAKQRNATILVYWLGRERSHLWIITAARVTHVQLPADIDIEKEVTAYRDELAGVDDGVEKKNGRGERLYNLLVAAAAPHIAKESRVILIPDRALHGLNFETLIVPAIRRHYWIEDVIASNASSLQLLAHEEVRRQEVASMLLVGDPVPEPAYPKLANAADELKRVGRHFTQRRVLEGASATPAAYRSSDPGRYAFLHFVAHGVSSRTTPLASHVVLGRDQTNEYKLFARDIVEQPLDARLVTISSCHSASGRTFAGEGLVGLAWAFMSAGADEVIAALWEVNDGATPALMDSMYAQIKAGKDPAMALRNAKLKLVRGGNVHRKPRYWAPFVLYSSR